MINLADYASNQDGQVFGGNGAAEDVAQLTKAMQAGDITGRDTADLTTASGSPLKTESLEKNLKVVTYSANHITFWKKIPKAAATNTVEEYNQLQSYGPDGGGFYGEGETPMEEDSIYVRRAQLVKYMGVTRTVTHPMTLVDTMIGNAIDQSVNDGTLRILKNLNQALYFGDADAVPQQFNGLLTQHRQNDGFQSLNDYYNSEVVIDARGSYLTESMIEDAADAIVSKGFGLATELYAPPKVLSNFVKNFYGNKFIQPNTAALSDGVMGQRVKAFESQFGNIGLNHDVFMTQNKTRLKSDQATTPKAPSAPTAGSATPVASDGSGKWASSDAGSYVYAVASLNAYGESALLVLNDTPAAVVAGGSIDLGFTAPSSSTYPASAYRVYRSQKGAADGDGDAEGVFGSLWSFVRIAVGNEVGTNLSFIKPSFTAC